MKYINLLLLIVLMSCSKDESTIETPDPVIEAPVQNLQVVKTGKFNGANGYPSNGSGSLSKDAKGKYYIVLENDFTTSFATGSVTMYLSATPLPDFNNTTSYIKLAVINKKGYHAFPLDGMPDDKLNNIVVWCQPAGVKFGHAEIK